MPVKSISFDKNVYRKLEEESEITRLGFSKLIDNKLKKLDYYESEIRRLEKINQRLKDVNLGLQNELSKHTAIHVVKDYIGELVFEVETNENKISTSTSKKQRKLTLSEE